jgi:hypothetical protein
MVSCSAVPDVGSVEASCAITGKNAAMFISIAAIIFA